MKKGFEQQYSNTPGFGSLNIFYNAGGKVESEGTRGISHLAEHLLCKAIDHLDEKFSAYGIEVNALTSEDYVLFYFNGLNNNLKTFEKDIINILSYIPSEEDFIKEKKIVLSEYSNTFSNKHSAFSNISRKYYNRFSAIGYYKDIENCTYVNFLNFINTHFKQPLHILRVGESEFSDYYSNLIYSEYTSTFYEQKDYGNEFIEYYTSSKNPFVIHWTETTLDTNILDLVSLYLTDGLKSPFYQELREKTGYVYYVGSGEMFDGNVKPYSIFYETESKNLKACKKIVKELFKNIKVDEERFENVKKSIVTTLEISEIFNYNRKYAKLNFENTNYNDLKNLTAKEFEIILKDLMKNFLKNGRIAIGQKGLKL